jgi:hypothetical protein
VRKERRLVLLSSFDGRVNFVCSRQFHDFHLAGITIKNLVAKKFYQITFWYMPAHRHSVCCIFAAFSQRYLSLTQNQHQSLLPASQQYFSLKKISTSTSQPNIT